MIATGTDIKPIEIVMFMRAVKSRILFEQMKGRGVRVIDPDDLRAVTPDARAKTHFVIVDCVGATETELGDTQPLERKKTVAFKALLEHAALGGTDPDLLSSLASRLSRLDRQCGPEERERIRQAAGGVGLGEITEAIVEALDPDRQIEAARRQFGLPDSTEPSEAQLQQATRGLLKTAVKPIATNPGFRALLQEIKAQFEQIIDDRSQDALLGAGLSAEAREKARNLVQSFERFLADNRDEIDALQFFYSQPYIRRLHYNDIKALAAAIKAPPRSWTPEMLWRAYETLDKDRVRGASGQRLLADIVSLVRFALRQEDDLVPYADQVHARFQRWTAQQANQGRRFTPEQVAWLQMIRDHIATSLEMTLDDFGYTPFVEEGGLGRAMQVFGKGLNPLIDELNEALAA
jgi:type I restriction enzyme R subunit